MSDPQDGDSPEGASDEPADTEGGLARVLEIVNQKGLHARASAKFVQTVERFNAEVRVIRGGERVGGTSIMVFSDRMSLLLLIRPGLSRRQRTVRYP